MITRILLTVLLLFIMSIPAVFAQTDEEDETSEDQNLEQIQRIKDIVASKVAELDLVEKKGLLGTVMEISNTQLTIEDNKERTRTIDIDELTLFEGDDDFGVSDLQEGDLMSFVGLYNKDTERLLARVVSEANAVPVSFSGVVVQIDEENFQLIVIGEEGTQITTDIERSTDTTSFETGGDMEESGFSQVETGQRVIVTGFYDTVDEGVLNATRVLHFIDVPPSPAMIEAFSNYRPDQNQEVTPEDESEEE